MANKGGGGSVPVALNVMLYRAVRISRLRSEKTQLSLSTYVCIKVLHKACKTAGEHKLLSVMKKCLQLIFLFLLY